MRYFRTALFVGFGLLVCGADATAQQQPGDCCYYTNRDGHTVPRRCGNTMEEPPPREATPGCRDGSYSYSQHHSGTCSGHGGVRSWRR